MQSLRNHRRYANQNGFRCRREPQAAKDLPNRSHKKSHRMVANQISFDLKSNLTSLENILPGIELFSQGATTQLLSPLLRFTSEFEMDRCGSTAPWTPGKLSSQENPENCIGVNNFLSPSGKKDFKTASLRGVWSSPRSISTPPLHALLRFHVEPINGCSSRDLTG